MVPAALRVDGHRIDHLAGVERRKCAKREPAHLHQVAWAQRARSPDPVRHHAELLSRLQHRDVRLRIREQLGEHDVARLVIVGLVADDLELLPHLLRAGRNPLDGVLVVGDVRLTGDVLVGHELRLAVDDPVAEPGAVH